MFKPRNMFWIFVRIPRWSDSDRYPKHMFCVEKGIKQCFLTYYSVQQQIIINIIIINIIINLL